MPVDYDLHSNLQSPSHLVFSKDEIEASIYFIPVMFPLSRKDQMLDAIGRVKVDCSKFAFIC